MTRHRTYFDSPVGLLGITASDAAITSIEFDAVREDDDEPNCALLEQARIELEEYFAGRRTVFDLPLEPEGSDWERSVWRALTDIPFSKTKSYGELARLLQRPGAARAIGTANRRNPIAIVIPCHRVIGADGSLTGYGGGLDRKRWLLDHERSDLA